MTSTTCNAVTPCRVAQGGVNRTVTITGTLFSNFGGTPTVVLRLDETASPTIIQQPDAGDMKTVVWAWIEPSSGRLLRAQVMTRDIRIGVPGFDAVIRVEFRANAELGLLVPIEMHETFYVDRGRPGTGVAKYKNYRRFQTSARIVPQ